MKLIEIINTYFKRKNLINDFVKLTKPSGIDHRFSGKGTNQSDKQNSALTTQDIQEICDGGDKFITEFKTAIDQARAEIKNNEPQQ